MYCLKNYNEICLNKKQIYGTNTQNLNNLELSSMAKDNSSLNVILIDFLVLFEFKTQDNITTKREPINYQHTTVFMHFLTTLKVKYYPKLIKLKI